MLGTGMLKPNVSTIVGQLYSPADNRRDAGFSIFYMGINLWALSPVIVGWVGEKVNWRLGFATSAIGMLIGVIQYLLTDKHLRDAGRHPSSSGDPDRDRAQKRNGSIAVAGSLLGLIVLAILASTGRITLTAEAISDVLGWVLIVIAAAVFSWMIFGKGWSTQDCMPAGSLLLMFMASAIFWAVSEQPVAAGYHFPKVHNRTAVLRHH